MARKPNAIAAATPPEPHAEAIAPPEPAPPRVVDMSVRDLLQMLGRTLPEGAPLQPCAAPPLPDGLDAEAKVGDLTAGELLGLLAASQ